MKALATLLLICLLTSCAERRIMKGMIVKYQVWYEAGTWELVDASPNARLTQKGCVIDQGKVIRCYVRSIVQMPVKDY